MEAIILAGGYGTRLRPLTYTRAKALLPIMNKPMIRYLIDSLPAQVDTIILAVNYRKDQIENYLQGANIGKELIINDEPKPLGTGGAVKFAEQHITGPFLVLNADVICSLNLNDMIEFHKKKQAVCTISLWPVQHVSEFGVVDIKKDGNVTGFVEKPKPVDAPSNLINAGAYYLQPEVLDYLETGRLVSMEKEIFPQIISDTGRFFGYEFQGHWIDVGRIKSYLAVHTLLMQKHNITQMHGEKCKINGQLSMTSIGNNCSIGSHSHLSSTVLFDAVTIEKNVNLEQCVIGEACHIEEGATLRNTVVGDHEHIKNHDTLHNTIVWTQQIPEGYPKKQIGNVIGED
jgi:mannose-1-phosphate guanylyltransferase